jgi:hypothetical protein
MTIASLFGFFVRWAEPPDYYSCSLYVVQLRKARMALKIRKLISISKLAPLSGAEGASPDSLMIRSTRKRSSNNAATTRLVRQSALGIKEPRLMIAGAVDMVWSKSVGAV